VLHPTAGSEICINSENLVLLWWHNSGFLILPYSFFKEVSFSLYRDHIHPLKRIFRVVKLLVTESVDQSICNEFDILFHQITIHPNKLNWQRIRYVFLFDVNSLSYYIIYLLLSELLVNVLVQEASKIRMHSFIPGNKFIWKGQSGHHTSLLQPKDGAKTTRKKYPLNRGIGHQSLWVAVVVIDPFQSPTSFLMDYRDVLYSFK